MTHMEGSIWGGPCFADTHGAPSLILRSDHEPLQWLRKQRDPRGKFARWIMELEQYDYQFEYKPGKENEGSDAFSRIPGERAETDDLDPLDDLIYMVKISSMDDWKQLLKREQVKDQSINIAREQLEKQNNVSMGRYKNYKQLFIQDDLMTKSGRVVVPSSLQYQVTKDFHNLHHWGMSNTYKEVRKNYYWPGMEQYIKSYCASCDNCLQTKKSNRKPKAELKPQEWASNEPGEAIALDLATMTPSYDGFKYIMLITDGMSKFTELCPLRNMTAQSVVKNIERNWIARHGIPSSLLSDQGTQVDGAEVRNLCDKYNIKKKRSSPYHPEGDGISERPIGVMKNIFRTKIADQKLPQRKWTDLVPEVQLAMNQKVHSSTNASPFELLFGKAKRFDTRAPQLQNTLQPTQGLDPEERGIVTESLVEIAKAKLAAAATKMKTQYDKNTSECDISVGDIVYIQREYTKKGVSKKLSTVYHEQSRVIDSNHPIYKVKRISSGKEGNNRLRKKVTLKDPNAKTGEPSEPRNLVNSGHTIQDDDDDEDDENDDLPLTQTTDNQTDNAGQLTRDEELTNNDEITVSLDPIAEVDGMVEPATEEPTSMGRSHDENGRVVSNRVRKSTRTDDFVYK